MVTSWLRRFLIQHKYPNCLRLLCWGMAFVVPENHPTPVKIFSNLLRIHTFIIQNWTAQKEFRIRTCNQGRVLLLTEDVSFFRTGVRLAFSGGRKAGAGLWTYVARPLRPQGGGSVQCGGDREGKNLAFSLIKQKFIFWTLLGSWAFILYVLSPNFLFSLSLSTVH